METLDVLLESARRHVRHDEEDVREWSRATSLSDSAILRARITAVADRMRATFAELAEVELLCQGRAAQGQFDESILRQIQAVASQQAGNADAMLAYAGSLSNDAKPGPVVLADLEMVRFEANELADVLDGEIQYWRGDKGISLD